MVPKLQTKHWLITLYLVLAVLITVQAGKYFISSGSYTHLFYTISVPDTVKSSQPDTLDINVNDSLLVSGKPGEAAEKANKFMLTAKIDYASADSISMDIKKQMAWMYGNASIEYEDIKLNAAIISIDFKNNTIHAYATQDSTGKDVSVPEFTQGTLSFKSKEIAYNFTSHKGLIQNVITKEGEGYLHGSIIKKINDSVTNVGHGEYTTCDLEDHPHFSLKYTKAIILSGNMIVTGPAYITVEGVPLPIALPFGLFPNKKGRKSGLIIPKYGESGNRGFYLEDGGYYFGINDYFDLKLTGDIYSHGSWAIKPAMTYKKRYRYSGSFSLKYAINIEGTQGTPDYVRSQDFFINWSHRQDPKARPNSVFSASVNAGSSSFNKYNPATVNDYLSNTFSSSVSYDMRLGTWGNLTTSARHSQNTSTKQVTLTLPEVSFAVNRIYPFKKKTQTGPAKWYESININYNMNTRNELNTYDSLVFRSDVADRFVNGMMHSIPVSFGNFKVLKYFSWNNSFNYNERWYTKTIRETWVDDTVSTGNIVSYGYINIDTITGFKAAHDFSFSSSLNTTVYGMKQFRKGPVRAIRHVMRPSVGFSFTPDFGSPQLGYWKTVQTDAEGTTRQYSVFGDYGTLQPLYGAPPSQKSGLVNFSIGNNLEMKVRSLKDTITGTKKVVLIDNLTISTSYDLARDSLRWSPINISATTTLFKKLHISYASAYSPYALYEPSFYGHTMLDYFYNPYYTGIPGPEINKSEYSISKKPVRFLNSAMNLSLGWDFTPKKEKKKKTAGTNTTEAELEDLENNPHLYIDWDNPWSLNVDYNFSYRSTPVLETGEKLRSVVQTLRVVGDVNITSKWKVSAQTGYDFQQKDFAFTQISIYRNLHCWEMRFNWIPYGYQKSWNFQINAKSSLLQDMKLTKKKDFRDNL